MPYDYIGDRHVNRTLEDLAVEQEKVDLAGLEAVGALLEQKHQPGYIVPIKINGYWTGAPASRVCSGRERLGE